MKPSRILLSLAVLGLWPPQEVKAIELEKLSVLYIGDIGTPRARHFEGFLRQNVGRVSVALRRDFKPAEAADADVVLLDWPQSDSARNERQGKAPLGDRADWTKPTVLLGSAGLNLAVTWKARGGSG
jgi:hypothetical protein